jgi:hypothetical protein
MSVSPGGNRPHALARARKVVRVANAMHSASSFDGGQRYSVSDFDFFEQDFIILDGERNQFITATQLLNSLPRARREAVSQR